MAMTPRLDLRQSQTLVMTPQLQQAIKLLQLSNLELSAYVESEIERNPLLERDDDSNEAGDGRATARDADDVADAGSESVAALDRAVADERGLAQSEALDVDEAALWVDATSVDRASSGGGAGASGDGAFGPWASRGGSFDDDGADLEQTLSEPESLRDHLMREMCMDVHDPTDRMIGAHLIDLLDEAGYVAGDIAQVAQVLGCEVARVEATLVRLQRLAPPGIFARNLAECLALQLEDRNRLDPVIQTLLDNLDLLARRDLAALTKACGCNAQELSEMVAEIRALDPKPAFAFTAAPAAPVTPDILMRPQPGGGWIIELNNDTLPRVLVNNRYYASINRAARSREDKQFINGCHQSATWLVKALHQRATTILKVATEIVRQQEAFFVNGVHHLRPLVLRDIATAVEMHESTVSRVTSNKYMATPRGIHELKYFFSPAIASAMGGAGHAAESVRHRIKALIESESAQHVLSDDQIVTILRAENIDIARRTVAKYREALGVLSSVQRRRAKTSCI